MTELATKSARFRSRIIQLLEELAKTDTPAKQHQGFLSLTRYRHFYQQGRISDEALSAALCQVPEWQTNTAICSLAERLIHRQDLYQIALLHELSELSPSQLQWLQNEHLLFESLLPDVSPTARQNLMIAANESASLRSLWEALVEQLDLPESEFWTETDLLRLPLATDENIHELLRQIATTQLDQKLTHLGSGYSLAGLVGELSGCDVLSQINQQLQTSCTTLLSAERGLWTTAGHQQFSVFGVWRILARQDASLFLHQLPDWQNIIAELPDDACTTIALQLQRFDIPVAQWQSYLEQISAELPLWAKIKPAQQAVLKPTLADFLAIRLTLDRLWLNQVCHDVWKIEAKLNALQVYFRKNLSEFWVRLQLNQGNLPEYLNQQIEALIIRSGSERHARSDWQQLADLILLRQRRLNSINNPENPVWRLFCVCQYLGINAIQIQTLAKTDLAAILAVLDHFSILDQQQIWANAYQNTLLTSFATQFPSVNPAHTTIQFVTTYLGLSDYLAIQEPAEFSIPTPSRSKTLSFLTNGLPFNQGENPFTAFLKIAVNAPLMLANTLTKLILTDWFDREEPAASPPDCNVANVAYLLNVLSALGLTENFADFVIFVEPDTEASVTTNRLNLQYLADFANRPDTRAQLSLLGVSIPVNTLFISGHFDIELKAWQFYGIDLRTSQSIESKFVSR